MIIFLDFSLSNALLRGSHGLMKSSSPEGPKAGLKGPMPTDIRKLNRKSKEDKKCFCGVTHNFVGNI